MEQSIDEILSEVASISQTTSIEDGRPRVHGVSVQFSEEVDDFESATKLLKNRLTEAENVREYSNMTGEGDSQVIVLIEINPVETPA